MGFSTEQVQGKTPPQPLLRAALFYLQTLGIGLPLDTQVVTAGLVLLRELGG
jgi:hypothetical protein